MFPLATALTAASRGMVGGSVGAGSVQVTASSVWKVQVSWRCPGPRQRLVQGDQDHGALGPQNEH